MYKDPTSRPRTHTKTTPGGLLHSAHDATLPHQGQAPTSTHLQKLHLAESHPFPAGGTNVASSEAVDMAKLRGGSS